VVSAHQDFFERVHPKQVFPVRTTLNLPAELLAEAQRLLGSRSKTDTVVQSLRELIRRKRTEELRELLGNVTLDVDVPRSRRRAGQ